jgi:hypothetical protein
LVLAICHCPSPKYPIRARAQMSARQGMSEVVSRVGLTLIRPLPFYPNQQTSPGQPE